MNSRLLTEIKAQNLPWLAIGGVPVESVRTETAGGFVLRTTGARAVELQVHVDDQRLRLELHEAPPAGATLPERMRTAARAPALQILPGLFALAPCDPGAGLALPIMEGMWVPASTATVQATVKLYFVMGLAMGFWATCQPGRGTVVGICDNPYLQFQLHGGAFGQRWLPEWLRDPAGQPLRMEIAFLEDEHWLAAAQEFRRYELAHQQLTPLSQRPAVRNLAGGANIKFFNYARSDDRQDKIALMNYAREMFGAFGSEAGFSWGAEHMDYWEGVLQIPLTQSGFHWWGDHLHARALPIFGAVFRDVLMAYQHQSCSLAENAPLLFLAALRSGQPPYYFFDAGFWEKNAAYVRKSYEVLAHLHRLTMDEVITRHAWLTADGTVEQTTLSDGTVITVNWSAHPYAADQWRLPGYGFFVSGPKLVAFWAEEVAGVKFTPALWAAVRADAFFADRPLDAAQVKSLRKLLK